MKANPPLIVVILAAFVFNTHVALSGEEKSAWEWEIEADANLVDYAFDLKGPVILRKSDSTESDEGGFQLITYGRNGEERVHGLSEIPSDAAPTLLGYVDKKVLIKYADVVDDEPVMVFVTYKISERADAREIGELIMANGDNQRIAASLHPNGVLIRQTTWSSDGSRQIKVQTLNLNLKTIRETVSSDVAENQHVTIEPALDGGKPKGFFVQSVNFSEDWEQTKLNVKMLK